MDGRPKFTALIPEIAWRKQGLILKAQADVPWLAGGAGPCFALMHSDSPERIELFVSGRDRNNRSLIGRAVFDTNRGEVVEVSPIPVMPLGERGSFDENGTSYPYLVATSDGWRMYYTGWIEGVQVRWYNDIGLATSVDGRSFVRHSRAPLALKSDADFIGIGSSCVIRHEGRWLMWFTRFDRWGQGPFEFEHYYNIKHAVSDDGISWHVIDGVCIDFADPSEYAIAKPCVLRLGDRFVMWYSYRGNAYRPGFAVSADGVSWRRMDSMVGIGVSESGWDADMLCYPTVVEGGDTLYMFYNGNGYGKSGLGWASIPKKVFLEAANGF